jgi:anti-sigma factor RsiW
MNKFTMSATNRSSLFETLSHLDVTRLWDVEWRERKSKRSLAQNDWARKYARDFGAHFGYDADFAYDMLMYKFNPVFKHDPEGNEIRVPGSFSKLETAQAAEVQDMMLRYGLENGFYWNE